MALVEQLLWPDDVEYKDVPIGNFQAGQDSDIHTVRIYVDRDDAGTGAVLKHNSFSMAIQDPSDPLNSLISQVAPMDGLWPQVRFVDASSNIEPYNTVWTRLGTSSILPFKEMVADSWRELEIKQTPPSYSTSNPYTFQTFIHTNETAFGLQGPTVDIHNGIITGIGDARQSYLIAGGQVTASVIPDDFIQVELTEEITKGAHIITPLDLLQITDLDGNTIPEALEIGESYIIVLSRNNGVLEILKGLRSDSPVVPDTPIDNIFQASILVDYTGGVPIIGQEDITMTKYWSHFYAIEQGGLTLRIHGGDMASSGTWKHRFEHEDLELFDDSINYIWLTSSGDFLIVQDDDAHPSLSANLLYEITTDLGIITLNIDRRFYIVSTKSESLEVGVAPGGIAPTYSQIWSNYLTPVIVNIDAVNIFTKVNIAGNPSIFTQSNLIGEGLSNKLNLGQIVLSGQPNNFVASFNVDATITGANKSFWMFPMVTPLVPLLIISATDTTPIKITTASNHELHTGDLLRIIEVEGTTNANGSFYVFKTGEDELELHFCDGSPSVGNGEYTSGGKLLSVGSGICVGYLTLNNSIVTHNAGRGFVFNIEEDIVELFAVNITNGSGFLLHNLEMIAESVGA